MEKEHEWGPNSIIDNGSHIAGGTGVLARGSAVPVASLKSGELYVVDTIGGDTQIWLYGDIGSGLQWNLITTIDHSQLLNRAVGDPHPIYLDRAGDDSSPNPLQMGGHILRMSAGAGTPNRTFGNLLLFDHAKKPHLHVGNLNAIVNAIVLSGKLKTATFTGTGTVNASSFAGVNIIGTISIPFFPEVTVKTTGGAVAPVFIGVAVTNNIPIISSIIYVVNQDTVAHDFQIRVRGIQ